MPWLPPDAATINRYMELQGASAAVNVVVGAGFPRRDRQSSGEGARFPVGRGNLAPAV